MPIAETTDFIALIFPDTILLLLYLAWADQRVATTVLELL